MVRIAIDAMGGDFGPAPIVEGTLLALKSEKFQPILVGKRDELLPLIPEVFQNRITIVDADDVISMDDAASSALKRRDSSIYKAVDLVRDRAADAVVSAGHSGATMSLATLRIGRLPGVLRPAIATLMPNTVGSETLVLDVGANVDSEPEHLVQFAIMGKAYATDLLEKEHPRVGLLANGEEKSKGNKVVKDTHTLLSSLTGFNFVGNVEGNDIFRGSVDVVVCDGFVGNVLLKTAEGTANTAVTMMKDLIKSSKLAMIGALLMRGVFRGLKKRMDYAEYGGAPLLGVNGCAIVSHGKSNPKAIKNAIAQAVRFIESGVNEDIQAYIERYQPKKGE